MAITEKQREEILEEERLRMQARQDYWRGQCGAYCGHGRGRHLFWGLVMVAGLVAVAHHFLCFA